MHNLIYTTNVILGASGKHDNTICANKKILPKRIYTESTMLTQLLSLTIYRPSHTIAAHQSQRKCWTYMIHKWYIHNKSNTPNMTYIHTSQIWHTHHKHNTHTFTLSIHTSHTWYIHHTHDTPSQTRHTQETRLKQDTHICITHMIYHHKHDTYLLV